MCSVRGKKLFLRAVVGRRVDFESLVICKSVGKKKKKCHQTNGANKQAARECRTHRGRRSMLNTSASRAALILLRWQAQAAQRRAVQCQCIDRRVTKQVLQLNEQCGASLAAGVTLLLGAIASKRPRGQRSRRSKHTEELGVAPKQTTANRAADNGCFAKDQKQKKPIHLAISFVLSLPVREDNRA